MKVKRINKNYYKIITEPICTCFFDEYLMKKASKILTKYKKEMEKLFENNKEHLIKEEWSLCYPNKEQTSFYGTNLEPPDKYTTLVPNFKVELIKNLFFIGNEDIYSKKIEKQVQKIIENEIK